MESNLWSYLLNRSMIDLYNLHSIFQLLLNSLHIILFRRILFTQFPEVIVYRLHIFNKLCYCCVGVLNFLSKILDHRDIHFRPSFIYFTFHRLILSFTFTFNLIPLLLFILLWLFKLRMLILTLILMSRLSSESWFIERWGHYHFFFYL